MNRRRCARSIRSNFATVPGRARRINSRPLFLNYAAGYARAGISCWVGFVIVRAGVDDERCAAWLEGRSGAVAQRDSRVEQRRSAVAISANFQIQQVTVVLAFRIVLAVFFPRRIKMSARRLEVGAFALSYCVNVDAVCAGRELGHVHVNAYAARGW